MISPRFTRWLFSSISVLSWTLCAQATAPTQAAVLSNGLVTLSYSLPSGTFEIQSKDGGRIGALQSAFETDKLYASSGFSDHKAGETFAVHDALGDGTRLIVTSSHAGWPGLVQTFTVYKGKPFVTVQAEIQSEMATGTRRFVVMSTEHSDVALPGGGTPRQILQVPYDNDMWGRYNAQSVAALTGGETKSSAEVTAMYDSVARQAIVIGSITHDVWKTAIDFDGSGGHLQKLVVYGGISSPDGVRSSTHNSLPHGLVTGTRIESPTIYVGFDTDWRDGLERYADVNAALHPPMHWDGPPPVGWNSWAAYRMKVTDQRFEGAAKFVHDQLIPGGFQSGGRVYINYDSSWNSMPEEKIAGSIAYLSKLSEGAKVQMLPGVYWTPFATWTHDLDQKVEGTNGRYTYRDIVLKGPDGQPLPRLDNALAIDPTHPGALMRMDAFVERATRLGFKYVKLDFLTHGALEGVHWDKKIETGNEAYEAGMEHLLKRINGRMFVSLSIAPLFPSGLGNSRRLSCDAMGHMTGENQSTEYMLNSLTYGWWTDGPLYLSDPDHVPLGTQADQGARSLVEGLSRFLSAVIGGGMVLDSSDLLGDAKARELATQIYTRPEVMAIAAEGRAFRPLTGDTGNHAASFFVRYETDGSMELAMFNFSDTTTAKYALPLDQLDGRWSKNLTVSVHDYWTGKTRNMQGAVRGELAPSASVLLKLTPSR